PAKPNGASCNDGSACTGADTCQSGVCTGGAATVCQPSDQCHAAGTCSGATGLCSNPALPLGSTCDDGDPCTFNDQCTASGCRGSPCLAAGTCQAGVCTGGALATCTPRDVCHVAGTCDPSTGACSNPPVANGATCDDGDSCTFSDQCTGGLCRGTAITC